MFEYVNIRKGNGTVCFILCKFFFWFICGEDCWVKATQYMICICYKQWRAPILINKKGVLVICFAISTYLCVTFHQAIRESNNPIFFLILYSLYFFLQHKSFVTYLIGNFWDWLTQFSISLFIICTVIKKY
jgi:hypothetical protein